MSVELTPAKLASSNKGHSDLDYMLTLHEMDLGDLGLLKRTYTSGVVVGPDGETPRVFVWSVLSDEVSARGLSRADRFSLRQTRRWLKKDIATLNTDIQVRSYVMHPERERALKDRLARNNIAHYWSDNQPPRR